MFPSSHVELDFKKELSIKNSRQLDSIDDYGLMKWIIFYSTVVYISVCTVIPLPIRELREWPMYSK